jgi:flagellar motility protein MotE (MotC chaperone)
LAILKPNLELEEEFQELKELGDQYRALEVHIKEKMKTFDTLRRE